MSAERKCSVCGGPLPKKHSRYCSSACSRKGRQDRTREITASRPRPPVYQQRTCIDCGKQYMGHIKSKRCGACQDKADKESTRRSIARRKSGEARKIGDTDYCKQCGNPYIIRGPLQRYCKDCAPNAWRNNDRAASVDYYRVNVAANPGAVEARKAGRRQPGTRACIICGKEFPTNGPKKYCSPECLTDARRQQAREAEARRGARKREK